MKYVIFQYSTVYMPVIVPAHVTHSQIKLTDAKPVSAGFFKMSPMGNITIFGKSESLKLEPHARDKKLIELALMGTGNTALFLVDNFDN